MPAVELNEGEIERMKEHQARGAKLEASLGIESPSWELWVQEARQNLEVLIEIAERQLAASGGTFAEKLRQALEERILKEVRGRAVLTNDVAAESVSVQVMPAGVWVDVRLRIGRWVQT